MFSGYAFGAAKGTVGICTSRRTKDRSVEICFGGYAIGSSVLGGRTLGVGSDGVHPCGCVVRVSGPRAVATTLDGAAYSRLFNFGRSGAANFANGANCASICLSNSLI